MNPTTIYAPLLLDLHEDPREGGMKMKKTREDGSQDHVNPRVCRELSFLHGFHERSLAFLMFLVYSSLSTLYSLLSTPHEKSLASLAVFMVSSHEELSFPHARFFKDVKKAKLLSSLVFPGRCEDCLAAFMSGGWFRDR